MTYWNTIVMSFSMWHLFLVLILSRDVNETLRPETETRPRLLILSPRWDWDLWNFPVTETRPRPLVSDSTLRPRLRHSWARPIHFLRDLTYKWTACFSSLPQRWQVQFTHLFFSNLNKHHESSWHYQEFT